MIDYVLKLNYIFRVNDIFAVNLAVRDEILAISSPLTNTHLIIILTLEDGDPHESWIAFNEIDKFKFERITIILDNAYRTSPPVFKNNQVELIYLHSYALITHLMTPTNLPSWNSSSSQGLFLLGDLNRPNRIEALYKMYKFGALDKIKWGVFVSDTDLTSLINYLLDSQGISESDAKEFINFCTSNSLVLADDANKISKIFDFSDFYQQTSFSIITETRNPHFVTEKTYRAILKQHPFLMLATAPLLKLLEADGFKTFKEYIPYPEYDECTNVYDKIELISKNIIAFSNNINTYKHNLQQDVLHNLDVLNKIIEKDGNLIKSIVKKDCSVDLLIDPDYNTTLDYNDWLAIKVKKTNSIKEKYSAEYAQNIKNCKNYSWLALYQKFKASDWPVLSSIEEFDLLDQEIKNELSDRYNLTPDSEISIDPVHLRSI